MLFIGICDTLLVASVVNILPIHSEKVHILYFRLESTTVCRHPDFKMQN